MKIDSHQHFWKYNVTDFGWIKDPMKEIRRDFLPEELRNILQLANYDASIAVQARQIISETDWLLELASQYNFISGVVGWMDLCSDNLNQQLEFYSANKKLVGVRHVLHDEPDLNFMLRPDFLKGIYKIGQYNLTYDILIYPEHLPNTLQFVKQFPNQSYVLDHIAKPKIINGKISPWKENIRKLAQYPNVSCKLSGMVTEADIINWKPEDFWPYLDIIMESFGTNRVMIGSDWPVCSVAGMYGKVMNIVENYIAGFSLSEKAGILGDNATHIYNIKSEPKIS